MLNRQIVVAIIRVGKEIYGRNLVCWEDDDWCQLYDIHIEDPFTEFPDGALCFNVSWKGGDYLYFSAFREHHDHSDHSTEDSFFYNMRTRERKYLRG
jgi:hypothetical protein